MEKLIIGQLNINSLRNKFDLLTYQIKDKLVILTITETKPDKLFLIRFSEMDLVVLSAWTVIEMFVVFCYALGNTCRKSIYL